MTTHVTSENTKKLLADTLKGLLSEKNFSKITITEIVKRSGVNRKTFYYHFRSTEDLLAWMIEKDALSVVAEYDFSSDLEGAIDFIASYLEENQAMLRSISGSIGRGTVHHFLFRNIYPAVEYSITKLDPETQFSPEFRNFVSEFYTEAIAGVLQNWLEKPILRDRRVVAEYTAKLVEEAKLHFPQQFQPQSQQSPRLPGPQPHQPQPAPLPPRSFPQ